MIEQRTFIFSDILNIARKHEKNIRKVNVMKGPRPDKITILEREIPFEDLTRFAQENEEIIVKRINKVRVRDRNLFSLIKEYNYNDFKVKNVNCHWKVKNINHDWKVNRDSNNLMFRECNNDSKVKGNICHLNAEQIKVC